MVYATSFAYQVSGFDRLILSPSAERDQRLRFDVAKDTFKTQFILFSGNAGAGSSGTLNLFSQRGDLLDWELE
jgi:hypothetical protein